MERTYIHSRSYMATWLSVPWEDFLEVLQLLMWWRGQ
jgi:hypothetical protein